MVEGQRAIEEYKTGNTKHSWDFKKLRSAHKILTSYSYKKGEVTKGYANRTLYVNLRSGVISEKPVAKEMKKMFTGGRGFGLKLLWDSVKPTTRWNSQENELLITTGPLCGATQYAGSGKSLCLSVSPSTNIICDCNVGGFFGPYLKFAGFDALEIQGKATQDVIVVIDGEKGTVSIETAPLEETNTHLISAQLTHLYATENTDISRQKVSVVSSGLAAEHSYWGCLNFSFYDIRRKVPRVKQAGRGGLGTVLRDKKIKALVVKVERFDGVSNHPADPVALAEVGIKLHREIRDLDRYQCNMRTVGTGHLVEIMDAYDLLPTENYRFGSFPKASKIYSPRFYELFTKIIPDGCWHGCTMACSKTVDGYTVMTGPYKGEKVTVDGPEYETIGACSNMSIWDPLWALEFNFYCDTYGIDTISAGTSMAFYMEMYEYGILNKERCDGLELCFGNADAALELLHRIAQGDNGEFIKVAAKGTRRVKDWIIKNGWGQKQLVEDTGMESKGLEFSEYVTKESLAMQGGYGLTLKGPQHDEAWLIFMDMVNNAIPTFQKKAEALHYFPMWRTWFGLNGLCKLPWNDIEPANNAETSEPAKVPAHVQNYVDYQNAMTGWDVTKKDLILQSERCYNWQRAMNVWMGRGQRKDDWIPFRAMGPVTEMEYLSRKERYDKQLVENVGVPQKDVEKMTVQERLTMLYTFRRNQYQKLADAVYYRRGWTPNGVPTPQKMKQLGFTDKKMLKMLQDKITADEKKALNVWGGTYKKGEHPPSTKKRYWEKWL
ncbi:MAG TPA: aldehyde ferredoxin oxidoreductase C-terminal domain-containing protein [Candidatus Thermoplasmatota archaeon]|nr:aldehyde ferredoxin oxidoreductase C-terminal domain-containing protein [Candidatus Thermoplasmatota archaeon]